MSTPFARIPITKRKRFRTKLERVGRTFTIDVHTDEMLRRFAIEERFSMSQCVNTALLEFFASRDFV